MTLKAKDFGSAKHPDDDECSEAEPDPDGTATESLSELGAPAVMDVVVKPQTIGDKKLRRLSLQSSKWSDHTSSTASSISSSSSSSSGSKSAKELNDLVEAMKKAMAVKDEEELNVKSNALVLDKPKVNALALKTAANPSEKVTALVLKKEESSEKLKASAKELPIHATCWSLVIIGDSRFLFLSMCVWWFSLFTVITGDIPLMIILDSGTGVSQKVLGCTAAYGFSPECAVQEKLSEGCWWR